MLKKNEIYEAEITGMTTEGSGVCRIDGIAVFVPMTAVGDKLCVKIVKVLKSYAFGIIAELTEPAQGRCEMRSPCRLSWGRRLAPRGTHRPALCVSGGFTVCQRDFQRETKARGGVKPQMVPFRNR